LRVNTFLMCVVYGAYMVDGNHDNEGNTTMDMIKNIRCAMVWRRDRELETMRNVCLAIDAVAMVFAAFTIVTALLVF